MIFATFKHFGSLPVVGMSEKKSESHFFTLEPVILSNSYNYEAIAVVGSGFIQFSVIVLKIPPWFRVDFILENFSPKSKIMGKCWLGSLSEQFVLHRQNREVIRRISSVWSA